MILAFRKHTNLHHLQNRTKHAKAREEGQLRQSFKEPQFTFDLFILKYLYSTYHVPRIVLGSGCSNEQADRVPALVELTVQRR